MLQSSLHFGLLFQKSLVGVSFSTPFFCPLNFIILQPFMNIFFLHVDPCVNASYYCDKHVVKIILEIAQMLWAAFGTQEVDIPPGVKRYKATHRNHPMTMWVGSSLANFTYTTQIGLALCREYTERYNKTHACEPIIEFLRTHPPKHFEYRTSPKATYAKTDNPPNTTPIPLCMDKQYHCESLIDSYRTYYKLAKRSICTWKWTPRPHWFSE